MKIFENAVRVLMELPCMKNNDSLRYHRVLNKNPVPGVDYFPSNLWSLRYHRALKLYKLLPFILVTLELDGMAQLLKI